jgi:Holliday junction resolvase RusA-like endonuclease
MEGSSNGINMNQVETIRGTVPSKSNCYRIGNNFLYKTSALTSYEKNFYIQCAVYRNAGIEEYFEIHLKVFYPNQRADLDNALKVILDCLQKAGAIKNDNKCVKIVAEKYLDKLNPRIEFTLNKAI